MNDLVRNFLVLIVGLLGGLCIGIGISNGDVSGYYIPLQIITWTVSVMTVCAGVVGVLTTFSYIVLLFSEGE